MGTFNSGLFNDPGSSGSASGIALVGTVCDLVRGLVNDQDAPGGTFASNDAILGKGGRGPFAMAYGDLMRAIENCGLPAAKREFYYTLPAYTSRLDPFSIGIPDFDEPEFVYQRKAQAEIAILTTEDTTPIEVTTDGPHGFVGNQEVIITGVAGTQAPWGRWYTTVTGPTTFTLNGSVSSGSPGIGGTVSASTFDAFEPVTGFGEANFNGADSTFLAGYQWIGNAFKFDAATVPVQLKITYWANDVPPNSPDAPLGIDGAENFLATSAAYYLAKSKGWPQMAADLKLDAYGPTGERDGSGGLLRSFILAQNRARQRALQPRRPFRRPRSQQTIII